MDIYKLNNKLKKYAFMKECSVNIKFECVHKRVDNIQRLKIAFIMPGVPKFSGGNTSILRIGSYLSRFGHDVSYVLPESSNAAGLKKFAELNLASHRGTFVNNCDINKYNYDVGIATFWTTAYYLNNMPNVNYKVYFIQDYEPYFYGIGDEYYWAKNSYNFNLYMISLGSWIKKIIKKEVEINIESIDFPYEPKEYKIIDRDITIGDKLIVAVYVKNELRRAPMTILMGLQKTKEYLGEKVEINVFGMEKNIHLGFANNLGQLKYEKMAELYRKSHLGIVASLTNISLVPFEMIASGIPVIDFREGSYGEYFEGESKILAKMTPGDLCNKIIDCFREPEKLNIALKDAQKKIRYRSWEKSSMQFNELIKERIINTECSNEIS